MTEAIGFVLIVGIPAVLFLIYLAGRIKYDGKPPTDLMPPTDEDF